MKLNKPRGFFGLHRQIRTYLLFVLSLWLLAISFVKWQDLICTVFIRSGRCFYVFFWKLDELSWKTRFEGVKDWHRAIHVFLTFSTKIKFTICKRPFITTLNEAIYIYFWAWISTKKTPPEVFPSNRSFMFNHKTNFRWRAEKKVLKSFCHLKKCPSKYLLGFLECSESFRSPCNSCLVSRTGQLLSTDSSLLCTHPPHLCNRIYSENNKTPGWSGFTNFRHLETWRGDQNKLVQFRLQEKYVQS